MNISRLNTASVSRVHTPLGRLETDDASLNQASDQVCLGLTDAVNSFPETVRPALTYALEESRRRVLEAKGNGSLNAEGSAVSLEMLREMTEGLGYLARGEVEILASEGSEKDCRRVNFKTPTNDVFRVRARAHRDRKGQARIGITQLSDDGVPVPENLLLDVRIDRDPRRGATIDVEFGKAQLNKKIHGFKKDGKSRKFINHHFRNELGHINRPEDFAQMVHDFQNDTLTVL